MLDANVKTQLKGYLANVTQPIEIIASTDDSDSSRELQSLLADIVEQSDKISLRQSTDPTARKPSFALNRIGSDMGVAFAGLPMGHEFTSLVLALLQVGGHPPKADAELLEQIRNLPGEYNFETYISLTCQNCPFVALMKLFI
jgi:alkyl hydroperoxide reductase subunit F